MFEFLIKILLAHTLGDFVFQSNKMIHSIEKDEFKSKHLYAHILTHFILLLIFTGFNTSYLFPCLLLSIVHFLIDVFTKIILKGKISNINNFVLDQTLHLTSILLFVWCFFDVRFGFEELLNVQNYLVILVLTNITFVAAIVIKKIMEVFDYSMPGNGLKDAGKYIGMLERLFIFYFVLTSFFEGIGFLLAAKSIFRFGDLKDNKDIKLTEYILIGTLLSFGIAIIISKIYLLLINYA
jgi:hypothetical protein